MRVSGARAQRTLALTAGDRVEVRAATSDVRAARARPDPARWTQTPFFKAHFRVLYQDESILALDKPAGIPVHPGPERRRATLIDLARAYLAARAAEASAAPEPFLAHRLDQQTSGVLLVAKTPQAQRTLAEAFRVGAVEKEYLALVAGVPRPPDGRVALPLLRGEDLRTGKALVRVSRAEGALSAATRYATVGAWRTAALLSVAIETGRMHQIRVHLAAIGHPVAGDARYGNFGFNRRLAARAGLRRLFLHAHRIGFAHPTTGRPVEIVSPLPGDLAAVLERLTDKRL